MGINTVVPGFQVLLNEYLNRNGITGIQTPGTDDSISGIVSGIGMDVNEIVSAQNAHVDENINDENSDSSSGGGSGGTPPPTPITTCPSLNFTASLSSVASGSPSLLVDAIQNFVNLIRVFVDPGGFPCTFSVIFDSAYTLPLFSGSLNPGDSSTGTLGATQTIFPPGFTGDIFGFLNITISMDIGGDVTVEIPSGSFTFASAPPGTETVTVTINSSSGTSP